MITTIIPTYQRASRLKNAIQSALDQTYSNLTVLVCDNASNDNTEEVVRSFMEKDARIQYFRQPRHISLNDNFETGLSLVKTPYYSFLCDDDFLFPWFYEDAVNSLEKEPQAVMFCGGTLAVDDEGDILMEAKPPLEGMWDIYSCPKEKMGNGIADFVLPACVFRKGPHENISRTAHKAGWDEAMIWNVILHYPLITTSKFVIGYRRHTGQDSHQVEAKDIVNEEKLEKMLIAADEEVKIKVRYSDEQKSRFRYCVGLILRDKKELALHTCQIVSKYNKINASFLFMLYFICKAKIIRLFLYALYVPLYKLWKIRKNFHKSNEHAQWIARYSKDLRNG